MSAQPVEPTVPQRVVLPRKIKAIREALTPEEREEFTAALDDAEGGGIVDVVQYWWIRGVMNLSGAWDDIRAVENGTARMIPFEDVLVEWRNRRCRSA